MTPAGCSTSLSRSGLQQTPTDKETPSMKIPSIKTPSHLWPPTPSPVATMWQVGSRKMSTVIEGPQMIQPSQQQQQKQPLPPPPVQTQGFMQPMQAQQQQPPPLLQIQPQPLPVQPLQAQPMQVMWVPMPMPVMVNPLQPPMQSSCAESAPSTASEEESAASTAASLPSAGQQLFSEAMKFLGSGGGSGNVAVAGPAPVPELLERRPSPSAGSALHGTGQCNPCAHYWKDRGCALGPSCDFCHLCEDGELKRRRKAKVAMMRTSRLRGARGA